MSGKAKFRCFLLVPFILSLIIITPPIAFSSRGERGLIFIENIVEQNTIFRKAGNQLKRELETTFRKMGFGLNNQEFQYQLKFKILKYDEGDVGRFFSFGLSGSSKGKLKANVALYHRGNMLGAWEINSWVKGGITGGSTDMMFERAIKEIVKNVNPLFLSAEQNGYARNQNIQLLEKERAELREERNKLDALRLAEKNRRLEEERKKIEVARKELEALRLAEEERQRQAQAEIAPPPQPPEIQEPQSGSGSGFFVSKMGHVITNAHVVQNCKSITIGDNANKQVPAEIINTDRSNDLALLKLSTLEMASAESKSLIQKLNIVVVPLASKGLLRSEDVRLGEKVLVAGYPFGDIFSNTIKVTSGIVSATRGSGDDSGQFQLDAAVQPGNSGGPIYDSGGNIVGVVISQLDKLKMAKAIGSLP
jgi:S1-C subfamily serine protease